jgi:hypothetical protein
MIINRGEETIHEANENPCDVECNGYWKKNDTAKISKRKIIELLWKNSLLCSTVCTVYSCQENVKVDMNKKGHCSYIFSHNSSSHVPVIEATKEIDIVRVRKQKRYHPVINFLEAQL